jgi:hypothetical protein
MHKMKIIHGDIKAFYSANVGLCTAFTMAFVVAVGIVCREFSGPYAVSIAGALCTAWGGNMVYHAKRWRALTERINDPNGQESYWQVDVNFTPIGRINDSEIARLIRAQDYDVINIWDDVTSFLLHWIRAVPVMMQTVPVITIWVVALGLAITPLELMESIEYIVVTAKAGGNVFALPLPQLVAWLSLIYISVYAILHMMKTPRSHRVADGVRQKLGCPADGRMAIFRCVRKGGDHIFSEIIQLT